ncbi:MAG TPA: glutaredoxin family protein [Steroidobacteraceae bacterium]|nr:glutaredoxin family protein [Steroidobacteraceae bacterium]
MSGPSSREQGGRAAALVLLTRPECELCEHMLAQLSALGRRFPLPPVEVRDVDSDPELQRRYRLKIPVLLMDGVPVCSVQLDAPELLRLLRL